MRWGAKDQEQKERDAKVAQEIPATVPSAPAQPQVPVQPKPSQADIFASKEFAKFFDDQRIEDPDNFYHRSYDELVRADFEKLGATDIIEKYTSYTSGLANRASPY